MFFVRLKYRVIFEFTMDKMSAIIIMNQAFHMLWLAISRVCEHQFS